jgi:hypothetical protein
VWRTQSRSSLSGWPTLCAVCKGWVHSWFFQSFSASLFVLQCSADLLSQPLRFEIGHANTPLLPCFCVGDLARGLRGKLSAVSRQPSAGREERESKRPTQRRRAPRDSQRGRLGKRVQSSMLKVQSRKKAGEGSRKARSTGLRMVEARSACGNIAQKRYLVNNYLHSIVRTMEEREPFNRRTGAKGKNQRCLGAQIAPPTMAISPGLIFSMALRQAGKYCRRCSRRLEKD